MHCVFFLWILYFGILCNSIGAASTEIDEYSLKDFLSNHTLIHRPKPKANQGRTNVNTSLWIKYLGDVDPQKMEMKTAFFFRHHWNDYRVKSFGKTGLIQVPSKLMDEIWTPDSFFMFRKYGGLSNGKDHTGMSINFTSGNIFTSSRYFITNSCKMNFKRYPFDVHVCELAFESYSHTAKDLNFEKFLPGFSTQYLHSSEFELVKHESMRKYFKTSSGTYQRQTVYFVLRRHSTSYVSRIILPSVAIVLLSCICYWFEPNIMITVRVFLGVGCLLSLIFLDYIGRMSCSATYTVYHDQFAITNFIFVSFALIELFFVQVYQRFRRMPFVNEKESDSNELSMRPLKIIHTDCILDRICRVLVPVFYILFAIIYWSTRENSIERTDLLKY